MWVQVLGFRCLGLSVEGLDHHEMLRVLQLKIGGLGSMVVQGFGFRVQINTIWGLHLYHFLLTLAIKFGGECLGLGVKGLQYRIQGLDLHDVLLALSTWFRFIVKRLGKRGLNFGVQITMMYCWRSRSHSAERAVFSLLMACCRCSASLTMAFIEFLKSQIHNDCIQQSWYRALTFENFQRCV